MARCAARPSIPSSTSDTLLARKQRVARLPLESDRPAIRIPHILSAAQRRVRRSPCPLRQEAQHAGPQQPVLPTARAMLPYFDVANGGVSHGKLLVYTR